MCHKNSTKVVRARDKSRLLCFSLKNGTYKRTQQIQDSDKIHTDANDQRVQSTVQFSPCFSSDAIHPLFEISSSTASS